MDAGGQREKFCGSYAMFATLAVAPGLSNDNAGTTRLRRPSPQAHAEARDDHQAAPQLAPVQRLVQPKHRERQAPTGCTKTVRPVTFTSVSRMTTDHKMRCHGFTPGPLFVG